MTAIIRIDFRIISKIQTTFLWSIVYQNTNFSEISHIDLFNYLDANKQTNGGQNSAGRGPRPIKPPREVSHAYKRLRTFKTSGTILMHLGEYCTNLLRYV